MMLARQQNSRYSGLINVDSLTNSCSLAQTRTPTWNEKFNIIVDDPFQELIVQVDDEDISRNETIGRVSIMIADVAIKKSQKFDAWFPLSHHITKEPITENVSAWGEYFISVT